MKVFVKVLLDMLMKQKINLYDKHEQKNRNKFFCIIN